MAAVKKEWDEILERSTEKPGLPRNPKLYSDIFQSWILNQQWVNLTRPKEQGVPQVQNDELISKIKLLKKELSACRGQIYRLCADLKNKPVIKQTELLDIDETFELIRPIPVIIEEYEDQVVASFVEVELVAYGDTESEAIINLKKSIIDLFNDLSNTPKDKLGKLPLGWIRILNKVMKAVG